MFCLSGRLPRRKESGCPIRDSASRLGVGVGNTPYQVLPVEFRHLPGKQTFLTPRPVQSKHHNHSSKLIPWIARNSVWLDVGPPLEQKLVYTTPKVMVGPKGPAILTSGLVQTLCRSFLTSTVVAVLEPSSKPVLPVALENSHLQMGHFKTGHFEMPRFPCSELQRLDLTHL